MENNIDISLIEFPTDKDWAEVKRRALITIGKKPVNPPDMDWKKSILLARHSPIRYLRFSFLLEGIPYCNSVHLCRHIHAQPYVRSQRNDRQKLYDRNKAPQDSPVDMIWDMNAEELITIAQKRLCNQADKKTREIVEEMRDLVINNCPEFSSVLVPPCELYGVCLEMNPCGKTELKTAKWVHSDRGFFPPIDICSNCGYIKQTILGDNINQPASNYCPNCGRRMV